MGKRKITAVIERAKDGTYSIYMDADDMDYLVTGTGKTVNEAMAAFNGGYEDMRRYYAEEGKNFEEVCRALTEHNDSGHILFALASFDNLAKAGRVSRVVGFIAGALNMRVLGRRTQDGKIDFFYKTRGETRMLAYLLEAMDHSGYDGSNPVVISHCFNENAARLLAGGIRNKWSGAQVEILPTSGLTSFYAEKQGLIVGY